MPAITSQERSWVLKTGIAIMLLTSLPYLLGFAWQDETHRFSGFVFAVEDGNSYIAKMLSGGRGAWLFRTPYTHLSQNGVLMFLPYLLLGKLAASPAAHEQQVALFHLFRFIAGLLFLLATYEFIAFFIRDLSLRRFGTLLAGLGGGLGWLLLLNAGNSAFDALPLEFYSPETFGFLSLYGVPHLAAARAFLLWTILGYLKFIGSSETALAQPVTRTGVCWLLAGLLQPLNALVIGFILGVHLVLLAIWQVAAVHAGSQPDWGRWRRGLVFVALAGIAPGILVLYLALMVRQDAFLQAWSSQNILPSPSPLLYLLSFGLLLPFAFAGARRYLQIDRVSGLLLVGWALALPLLAYFPVNVQRRLPEGQWLTWCILALLAVEGWWEKPSGASRLRRIALIAPLCLSFMATLLLFVGGLQTVLVKRSPVFLDGQEVAMFEFLAEDGEPGCLVVADFGTGNALPAWAPMRVVIGHGPESAGLATLREQVREFYSAGTPDAWRKEWLARLAACYVFWGPAEQALGDWDPRQSSYLEELSSLGPYSLLKVIPE